MRTSGILLHISSLPGKEGIGTIGKGAYDFIRFLSESGVRIWQMLPVGPTGYGDSPYQSPSTFAGNPLFIDLELLVKKGFLPEDTLIPSHPVSDTVDFETVKKEKMPILEASFAYAWEKSRSKAEAFRDSHTWVHDYAVFSALKDHFNSASWMQWPDKYRLRDAAALQEAEIEFKDRIDFYVYIQYLFDLQWQALRKHAKKYGILLFGDMPIYVAEDSADTWSHPENFQFDGDRRPLCVAGVPPDYFSQDGQLWGNPLYNWKLMKKNAYSWWIDRLQTMNERFDLVRIDHFIGFANYYSVPYGAPNARNGEWIIGPGRDFFRTVKEKMPGLRIIAEDLGAVNRRVRSLLSFCGYPGMKVLQFSFDGGAKNQHLPKNTPSNSVVYTATHDNDTTVGWFKSTDPESRKRCCKITGATGPEDVAEKMIRTAFLSSAETAVVPMQDILSLDTDARMNMPGSLGGNWKWRLKKLPGKNVRRNIRDTLAESQRI
ncbi:MAG: 4-alpha-glucanotransferase [Clostridia bacterium]|nr:4-alpha-glucanotransferase [Clostridia bacterium]